MKQYGLIGYPLTHSFSKKHFTEKFQREAIDAQYELFELQSIEEFNLLVEQIELQGLNVTIPYKEQVIPYLDSLDEAATAIRAVNVIRFQRNGDSVQLIGHNSDYIGFAKSIEDFLMPHHKKALILGTGGASKAVEYALVKKGLEVKFVSRRETPGQFTYKDLNREIMADYQVIVNSTPLGTFPNIDVCPAIPYELLTAQHLLYDLVYNPAETLFMRKGKEQGAQTVNGEEMLVLQAEEAWRIWNEEN